MDNLYFVNPTWRPLTTKTWGGIVFEGTNASSIIKYSEIRYADVGVVFTRYSMPRVIASTIHDNGVGIVTFDLSSRIDGNQIHGSALWGNILLPSLASHDNSQYYRG